MIAALVLSTPNLEYWLCEMPLASDALIFTQFFVMFAPAALVKVPFTTLALSAGELGTMGTIRVGSAACAPLSSSKAVIANIVVPLPLTAPRAISLVTIKRPSILLRTIL